MVWHEIIAVGEFFVGVIIALALYANTRKLFPLMYEISVLFYIFTVAYVIEEFNLSKDMTVIILAVSAVIMILLGFYLSRQIQQITSRTRR
ncbi:MAG: hypothetical protein HYW22_02965 [Candidatus Aenigmarchaeota archaeon]|nr:hypothetical protein [Candidatus Aenigmarchaeota archaeon]